MLPIPLRAFCGKVRDIGHVWFFVRGVCGVFCVSKCVGFVLCGGLDVFLGFVRNVFMCISGLRWRVGPRGRRDYGVG